MSKETFEEKMKEAASRFEGILLNYAKTGWIDSIAKVLIFTEQSKAEEVIKEFPEQIQKTLKEKLAYYNDNPEQAYAENLHVMNTCDDSDSEYYKNLFNEMHSVSYFMAGEIIDKTCGKNIVLAEKLKSKRFDLDDIVQFDDRAIQKILREVDAQELAKALKITSAEAKEKIFRNMSHRAADMLKEDMEFLGPLRKSDALDTKRHIVSIILHLEETGEIVFPTVSDEETVS